MSDDANEDEEAFRTSTPVSASSSMSRHSCMLSELSDGSDVDMHLLDPSLQPTQGMDQLDKSGDGKMDAATTAAIQELKGCIHGLHK